MATDQRVFSTTLFSADADFRAWGVALAAQFAAVGLVKTADSGQIDWTTVLKPTGTNQPRGYEIWRFNDALQATKPVFIRIDYGSGGNALYPSLWVTVGTATNGAGALTGQVGTQRQISATGATPITSYCSGSSSRLNLAHNMNIGPILLCVERTKTGAGVDTGDGIVRYAWSSASGLGFQLVPFIGTIPAEVTINPALDINSGGLSAVGADVALAPTVTFYGKPLFASWCIYKITEITGLTPISFAHLGATRTYMPLGSTVNPSGNNLLSTSGYALAMLWE
jgi:hypothetical protein